MIVDGQWSIALFPALSRVCNPNRAIIIPSKTRLARAGVGKSVHHAFLAELRRSPAQFDDCLRFLRMFVAVHMLRICLCAQVESLSPGHYFDSRREGSTLVHPRKVATEIMRKLPRMLPTPPHPASAVFAVVEEDALNFSRFVISGPMDSPYENGLFVFDVFLPAGYPIDPPLVQMVTTGQGTVK